MSADTQRLLVGACVILLSIGIVAGLFLFEIPKGNAEVALVVLGVAIGWAGSVVQYHFGSSEGSSRKTGILHDKIAPLDLTGAEQ